MTIFKKTLESRIKSCISQAETARLAEHNGLAGEIREILISNVLQNLLPDGFKIGTGKIADSKGNLSNQSDIIIYNSYQFPPILFDSSKGFFPIESVAYVIEVKTTLNATEIKTTIDKAKALEKLEGQKPHFVLFAFNSDLKNKESDLKRMEKYMIGKNPVLNIFCIVNRIYGYYLGDEGWGYFDDTDDNYEVTCLVIGILNTLMTWRPLNNKIVPGNYFAKE
jgi:hypothetical protein